VSQPSRKASLATWIATGLGSGLSPVAPGTAGTIAAVVPAIFLARLSPDHAVLQLAIIGAVSAAGIWAAGIAAREFGVEDPGQVVIDEFAGYFVSIALLPPGWTTLVAGFVLFRIFDVTKPPPCRRAERLPGGLGIVADDLMAGVYANLSIRVLCAAGILSL
jgi:phosphatidylglycerophosphatase A